jgi:hypothetical protein
METAIYLNQQYRVLSKDKTVATLLSITDEIIEVSTEKITIFKKLVKRSILKRKRISVHKIIKQSVVPVELRSFDNFLANEIKAFKAAKA